MTQIWRSVLQQWYWWIVCIQVVHCCVWMWTETVAASGDFRPGICVGKADMSEAAGSPALSFPWWKGTRRLLLQSLLAAAPGLILFKYLFATKIFKLRAQSVFSTACKNVSWSSLSLLQDMMIDCRDCFLSPVNVWSTMVSVFRLSACFRCHETFNQI